MEEVRVVRAAGGLVFRRSKSGILQVLLVHRPRYDDWTFPKGKLMDVEGYEEGAKREVEEETGFTVKLKSELSSVAYIDRKGQPKCVRYWAMEKQGGRFKPNVEVDAARWMPVPEALTRLTYDRDQSVLLELQNHVRRWEDPLLLLRHASAGKRGEWTKEDALRPLDGKGRRQAEKLVDLLDAFRIHRILTSPYLRCVQTVEPIAKVMGVDIETREELAEGAGAQARGLLEEVVGSDPLLCTHGDVIAELIGDREAKKGSVWVLKPGDGSFSPTKYLPPPA